ncbi:MAG: AI-2E family transporter [Blautia wexlerae]
MVLPQLIRSIMSIIYSFPYYIKVIEKWLNSFVEHGWKLNPEMLDMINQYSAKAQEYLTTDILPQMQDMLKNVSAGIFDILIFMKNFLIGAIVALYVLADKEKFVAKSKMMVYAVLPHKWANLLYPRHAFYRQDISVDLYTASFWILPLSEFCAILECCFRFAVSYSGQCNHRCEQCHSVFWIRTSEPFHVSCLILVVDPLKGLYFAIFILLLQQFDGNILGPKILGDSTGLSSFMVIVAIMIGGGLFGVPGMIAGVPVFAVLYALIWRLIDHSLNDKRKCRQEEAYVEY